MKKEGPCLSEPCQNEGTCIEHGAYYSCDCKEPYLYGKNCTSDNPCFEHQCPDYTQRMCLLNKDEKPFCVSHNTGFMNVKTKV